MPMAYRGAVGENAVAEGAEPAKSDASSVVPSLVTDGVIVDIHFL